MTIAKSFSVLVALTVASAAASIAARGLVLTAQSSSQQPDWKAIEEESMRHYQAVLRLDTANPPGNETQVADYLKQHGADTVIGQLNWDEKGDLTKSTDAWFIFSNGKFTQAAD